MITFRWQAYQLCSMYALHYLGLYYSVSQLSPPWGQHSDTDYVHHGAPVLPGAACRPLLPCPGWGLLHYQHDVQLWIGDRHQRHPNWQPVCLSGHLCLQRNLHPLHLGDCSIIHFPWALHIIWKSQQDYAIPGHHQRKGLLFMRSERRMRKRWKQLAGHSLPRQLWRSLSRIVLWNRQL